MGTSSTRREFLRGSGTSALGLVIGFHVVARKDARAAATQSSQQFAPNAFVRIAPDNTITVISKHVEHGVGLHTGAATLVAEELDADWSLVRVAPAPANTELYKNFYNNMQSTRGSQSMRDSYEQYRKAGATARAMLISAAAQRWNVPAHELVAAKSVITHPASRRKATYGDLAQAAAAIPVPSEVTLKDPKNFTLIGNETLHRVDHIEKTNGKAQFSGDVKLPGMLIAVVAHSPRFGGTVKSFDAAKARAIPGVVDVVQIPSGVAVLANSFWVAQRARDALQIEWDDSRAEKRGSVELRADYSALLEKPGKVAQNDGDAHAALTRASRVITATYEIPYLAHAPIEPEACVARLANGRCEIWTGDGSLTGLQQDAAKTLGLKTEQVEIHSVYAGGAFGHGGMAALEAVEVVKAIRGRAPVKLQRTRPEELQNDQSPGPGYRKMMLHKVSAGLDGNGNLIAYQHRAVGQEGPGWRVNGFDVSLIGGIVGTPYNIPNIFVDVHTPTAGIPVTPYRGAANHCFVIETFLDELAHAAGRDPLEFRRALLATDLRVKPSAAQANAKQSGAVAPPPRERRLLEVVAEKSGWGTPLGPNRGRGIAVHDAYGTALAQVAEVTTRSDGSFKVDRVVCAIDCGVAVNPDVIRAQIEGGAGFNLSDALYGEITLKDGVIEQTNFHDYPLLRIHEMPKVEVHILPSIKPPTGVGEPAAVVTSAAVANAVFAATGKRTYRLPFHRRTV
jgi:isoquinoline 1-oxidoreductase subunit beta